MTLLEVEVGERTHHKDILGLGMDYHANSHSHVSEFCFG